MGLLSGLFGSKIGYGAQPGGVAGGYGGMLGGGNNTSPMGSLSDILTGLGVGLLSQGPSSTPISPFAGLGQGLQYANQLGQQRRATGQQQFQNQLLQRSADQDAEKFGFEKQNMLDQKKQQEQQQAAIAQWVQTQPADQQALFQAYPDQAVKAYFDSQKQPEPSADMKNYQFYAQQETGAGRQPLGFNDWALQQKRATANNTTVNMPPAESSFQTALGKSEGGEVDSISGNAGTARAMNDQLAVANALRSQLQAAGTDTGKLLPIVTQISSIGQAIGVDTSRLGGQTPDATAAAQALDSITKKLALGNIGSGKEGSIPANNFTEADRNFVVGIAPNIADTPEGFGAKSLIQQRVNQRSLDKESMWNSGKYNSGPQGVPTEGDYRRFKKDWAEYVAKTPLFSAQEKQNFMQLVRTGNAGSPGQPGTSQSNAPIVTPQLPSGFQ
jgi:hypothetical protein